MMLFLVFGFICLVMMLFTKTYYLYGGLSVLSFLVYFIIMGNGTWITLLLFLVGILLMILEVFVPGFGLIGITGAAMLGFGYFLNYSNLWESIFDLSVAIVVAVVTAYILLKKGYKFLPGKVNLVLSSSTNKQKGYSSGKDYTLFLGKTGTALTTLRPSGKADINGKNLDVVSNGPIISEGASVQVINVEGIKITVKEL
ncbi:hydrolase [Jeotgalibaca sp. MA1X17-3]|uniref:NfeD family protein n=1 Tax=Jeotgalibaca sp. MA1X17-3 TaxID=2908211 RepID=UPI001F19EB2B|nr:NfeD family protein [Jeotgalibaca sp. MA1X17-3]UJF14915.1 hydrolase [Jeotgalibaca sp. MA1X17-3]